MVYVVVKRGSCFLVICRVLAKQSIFSKNFPIIKFATIQSTSSFRLKPYTGFSVNQAFDGIFNVIGFENFDYLSFCYFCYWWWYI